MTLGEKINPILEELHGALWEFEANCPGVQVGFNELSLIYSSKIFASTLIEEMWKMQEKEGMAFEERVKMAEHAGDQIYKLCLHMTNIDTKKAYKK